MHAHIHAYTYYESIMKYMHIYTPTRASWKYLGGGPARTSRRGSPGRRCEVRFFFLADALACCSRRSASRSLRFLHSSSSFFRSVLRGRAAVEGGGPGVGG